MSPACPICGATSLTDVDRLAGLPFRRCATCGFVFKPEVDADELRSVYEGGEYEDRDFAADYATDAAAEGRTRNARARLAWVLRRRRRGRLLDVGAAAGAFVAEAGRAGFDASGIEPAPAFARYARERAGVDVRHARLEDADLPAGGYDVITLWHVLEHIPQPVQALRTLGDALAPGGLLVIEVPNLASVMAQRLGAGWTHLDPTVHVNQFDGETLSRAMTEAGLRPVERVTIAHGEALRLRERLDPRHAVHRARLAAAGAPRSEHPTAHELLRVTATPR